MTLCSIPDVTHALAEIRRVLRPGGKFVFMEHGLAPEPRVARLQQRLEPYWKPMAGGCHLARPIRQLVEQSGLAITEVQSNYLRKTPRFVGYLTEGLAERV
jgi:ubiquinone/menaquinone biosynthesis C-methylase UbiE